jgi:DNA mismatch repair ATPase MutL
MQCSLGLQVHGLVTNTSFSAKRFILLLFINKRMVESANLKRAIEDVYAEFLPRGGHPFVYVSLQMPPSDLDVNVHPTKREIHLLKNEQVRTARSHQYGISIWPTGDSQPHHLHFAALRRLLRRFR